MASTYLSGLPTDLYSPYHTNLFSQKQNLFPRFVPLSRRPTTHLTNNHLHTIHAIPSFSAQIDPLRSRLNATSLRSLPESLRPSWWLALPEPSTLTCHGSPHCAKMSCVVDSLATLWASLGCKWWLTSLALASQIYPTLTMNTLGFS